MIADTPTVRDHANAKAIVMPDRTVSFDLIPDAIVTVDRSGIIRQVNSQLTAMFGYQAGELIGQPIEILLPERARQRHVHHRTAFYSTRPCVPWGEVPNCAAVGRMAPNFRSTSC
jgi:PAS domain-containing protein